MKKPHIALIYPKTVDYPPLSAVGTARIEASFQAIQSRELEVEGYALDELPASLDGYDFVVALGGDGTQLHVAQRLLRTPLCAIRLFPERSVGFLCTHDYDEFEPMIDRICRHEAAIECLDRLQVAVNGHFLPVPILNDVLIANRCPARGSRYEITWHDVSQKQCSSGVWIATQVGSHGASHSAGAPILEEKGSAVFCVRECADRTIETLTSACFKPDEESPQIRIDATAITLFIDGGIVTVPVSRDDVITFRMHPNPLRRLGCP